MLNKGQLYSRFLKSFSPYLITLLILILMASGAIFFDDHEIVLPEVAALAVGVICYREMGWIANAKYLFIAPAGTAIIGFAVNFIPVGLIFKLLIVLILMLIYMYSIGTRLGPSLATGFLPVITNSTSIHFLLSILVFTVSLALIARYIKLKNTNYEVKKTDDSPKYLILFTVLFAIWLLVCHQTSMSYSIAIPPVFVVAFEYLHKKEYKLNILLRQIAVLVIVSFLGVVYLLHSPNIIVATLLSFISVFVLLQVFRIKIPPAYAMGLLPMVLPIHNYYEFPLMVFFMSIFFLGTILLLKNRHQLKSRLQSITRS